MERRSRSQASFSRHSDNPVHVHVTERTHGPFQLILIASEGLGIALQLSNGFRLRTLFMIISTVKADVALFCFYRYRATCF